MMVQSLFVNQLRGKRGNMQTHMYEPPPKRAEPARKEAVNNKRRDMKAAMKFLGFKSKKEFLKFRKKYIKSHKHLEGAYDG